MRDMRRVVVLLVWLQEFQAPASGAHWQASYSGWCGVAVLCIKENHWVGSSIKGAPAMYRYYCCSVARFRQN